MSGKLQGNSLPGERCPGLQLIRAEGKIPAGGTEKLHWIPCAASIWRGHHMKQKAYTSSGVGLLNHTFE